MSWACIPDGYARMARCMCHCQFASEVQSYPRFYAPDGLHVACIDSCYPDASISARPAGPPPPPSTRASTVFRWKTGSSSGSTRGPRDFPKLQKHRQPRCGTASARCTSRTTKGRRVVFISSRTSLSSALRVRQRTTPTRCNDIDAMSGKIKGTCPPNPQCSSSNDGDLAVH